MIQVQMNEKHSNRLGRLGENEHRQMIFDLSEWTKLYPNATYLLINCPPGDYSGYPVATVEKNGNRLIWTITSTELTKAGFGLKFCPK